MRCATCAARACSRAQRSASRCMTWSLSPSTCAIRRVLSRRSWQEIWSKAYGRVGQFDALSEQQRAVAHRSRPCSTAHGSAHTIQHPAYTVAQAQRAWRTESTATSVSSLHWLRSRLRKRRHDTAQECRGNRRNSVGIRYSYRPLLRAGFARVRHSRGTSRAIV